MYKSFVLRVIRFPLRMFFRLHIVNGGRSALLNYLRNLTSQAIILSFALIVGHNLEPKLFYWENTGTTISFVCLLLISIFAMWANTSTFIYDYLTSCNINIKKEAARIEENNINDTIHLLQIIFYSSRKEITAVIELFITITIVLYGFGIVVVTAIASAYSFLNHK